MSEKQVIADGVYLERIQSKVGTGDTAKAATMENYWRAKPLKDGRVRVELLDMGHEPTGYGETVDLDEFFSRFTYQPDFDKTAKNPKAVQADKISARGERHLANEEYLSAEFEFSQALKLDDDNVRANFGLGQTLVATGETEKAKEVFSKLSNIDAVLDPRNKHIFNECGINMRKLGMYADAVRYYKRALDLGAGDENLWFNLARALWEGGQKAQAQAALERCLQLNPDLESAKIFLAQMKAENQ